MRSALSNRVPTSASILLVDDNGDGILARRTVLEELGYKVVSAGCGSDALQKVEKQKFDLIITDFKMSPMNGVELIGKLRELSFANPIILLTGFAESVGLKPDNTGADVVIQKSANEVATLVRHTQRLIHAPKKPARSNESREKSTRSRAAGS
jgi:CheY-like chemotaxis protein